MIITNPPKPTKCYLCEEELTEKNYDGDWFKLFVIKVPICKSCSLPKDDGNEY